MSLFKVCRGAEGNLPTIKTDGYAYFCTDTGSFYIDHKNASNVLVRSKISANYADKLRYVKDGQTVEIDASKVITTENIATTIGTATTQKNGLMSKDDKIKLDGIATNANNYTHPTYTARTGKPTANVTPGFGETVTISQVTSDSTGHVSNMTDRTITIPNAVATTGKAGLMSKEDKIKLDGIATGAEKNIIYIGDTEPTDPNIKVWINTAEEGTGVIPLLPRLATITLTKNGWTGSTNPYSQTVTVSSLTATDRVELCPTAQQIVSLQNDDVALMAENNGGSLIIYSIGGKPSTDMTMQILLSPVSYV